MNTLSYLQNIYWREPIWLILCLQPLLIMFIKKLVVRNKLSHYADKHLQPWLIFPSSTTLIKQFLNKNILYLLAWLLFSIALAGPRIPLSQINEEKLSALNIMLVVDLSRSMKVTDIEPNRLRRAKTEIFEFLEKAQQYRIGITVFSARPHLFVPLTSDHAALKTYLDTIDYLQFPTTGSNPVSAIELAQQELVKQKQKSAIILISDGDYPSSTYLQLQQLKLNDIPLYILGIGTVEGEAIQLEDGTWLKQDLKPVVSRMNEKALRQLAIKHNGKYSPSYSDNADWNTLFDKGIARQNTFGNIKNKQQIIWRELFPYFLLASIFLFILSLSTYRLANIKNRILILPFVILIFSLPEKEVYAIEINETAEQSAYRAYKDKKYTQAENLYKNIRGYHSLYGQGSSLYKMGHFKEAIKQFSKAVVKATTDSQRANALYNLANSYFRSGDFSSAINTYKDVLNYQPENTASLYNMNVSRILRKNIERRLKEREKTITTQRQGRGARSQNAADGTELSENTSVSMGDNKSQLNDQIPLPNLPDINEDTVKKLLLTGLENVQFAEDDETFNRQSKYTTNTIINLTKAQQQLNIISDSQHLLWKRLFEIEEGFPAPVEKARTLPGVDPW